MNQTDLWVLLLVLGGAAIMAGSIIQGMRVKRSVSALPAAGEADWRRGGGR